MERLLAGEKSMLIRGAAGRKLPHGRVFENDTLYFINNDAEGLIKASGVVSAVINSEKMTPEESVALVDQHADKLRLSSQQYQRWAGKRYLVFIEVTSVTEVEPFPIDKSNYDNMEDWLPVIDINSVKLK